MVDTVCLKSQDREDRSTRSKYVPRSQVVIKGQHRVLVSQKKPRLLSQVDTEYRCLKK